MPASTLNTRNLQNLTALLFYAEGHQVKETELMEKLLKGFLSGMEFFKVNILANPKMRESFHVRETPLLLFLHNGKEIWRQAHAFSKADLVSLLGAKIDGQEKENRSLEKNPKPFNPK
jgi:hypothetical protein